MSLERLYYFDPFSNIVLSCRLNRKVEAEELTKDLQSGLLSVPVLAQGISLGEQGQLVYEKLGYCANLHNISSSDQTDEEILWELMSHAFDLPKGESIKIVYKPTEEGYVLYLCMHHLIGDANSLLLLLRQMLCGAPTDIPESASPESEDVELDPQSRYLLAAIEKQCVQGKPYSLQDYLSMHERSFARSKPEISKICVQEQELLAMKKHCKEQGISLTAYMVSELANNRDLDLICLPVDTRSCPGSFGNFVGRIDIDRRFLRNRDNIPQAIQSRIRQALEDRDAQARSQQLLSRIPPQFYDDVIFDRYGDRPKPSVRSTAKLLGYKDPRPTAFLSNLKEVQFQAEGITELCFYPPHPAERYATIGVVTYNNQMVITVQKFRKDGCNE